MVDQRNKSGQGLKGTGPKGSGLDPAPDDVGRRRRTLLLLRAYGG